MSRKQKPVRKADKTLELSRKVARHLQRHDYEQAARCATACFAESPDDRSRNLVAKTHLLLARQRLSAGNTDGAKAAAEKLINLGVSTPEYAADFAKLLVELGMAGRVLARNVENSADPLANWGTASLIDQAIVKGKVDGLTPDLAQGVNAVRQALLYVEQSVDESALDAVRPFARQSPFADWKLLVRGLLAYHRNDLGEMRANWERLDARRAAARIARPLAEMAVAVAAADRTAALQLTALAIIEEGVNKPPVLPLVQQLRSLLAADGWSDAPAVLRELKLKLTRLDPALGERLTECLYAQLIEIGARELADDNGTGLLEELTDGLVPLPKDPKWHRLWAFMRRRGGDPEKSCSDWLDYAGSIASGTFFAPAEKELAQAMIWHEVAEIYLKLDDEAEDDWGKRPSARQTKKTRDKAVKFLRKSIDRCPGYAASYRTLAAAYDAWEQEHDEAKTWRELLAHLPDDLDALQRLATYHRAEEQPLEALELLSHAHRLRPLDESLTATLIETHYETAALFAKQNEWERGRAQCGAVQALRPAAKDSPWYWLNRQLLECKAGHAAAQAECRAQAERLFDEPAGYSLALALTANRYKLAKAELKAIEALWRESLKPPIRPQAASAMCAVMLHMQKSMIECSMEDQFEDCVLKYLGKATNLTYQESNLRCICRYLEDLIMRGNDQCKLLKQFAATGQKQHPNCAYFAVMSGESEFQKGPIACDRKAARKAFETALRILETQKNPGDEEMLRGVKERLETLGSHDSLLPPELDHLFDELGGLPDLDGEPGFFKNLLVGAARRMANSLGIKTLPELEHLDDDEELLNFPDLAPPASRRPASNRK